MTDDRAPDEKPIVLPKVDLVSGFEIRCGHVNCGRIGFHRKRVAADELAAAHRKSHEAHERSIRALLKDYQADEAAADEAGVVLTPKLHCTGCMAGIGEEHSPTCDVARCLATGAQRKLRSHIPALGNPEGDIDDPHHRCGSDVWTGYYPGEKEAALYGVPLAVLKEHGVWDFQRLGWTLPDDWAEKANAPGKAE